MAAIDDWKKLLFRWNPLNFQQGDPKLDAIADMFKSLGLDWKARAIENDQFFNIKGSEIYTVGSVGYAIIKTNDKPLRLVDVGYQVSYGDISDGRFTIRSEIFIQGSDQNQWSYTGGTVINAGKPLNTTDINEKPVTDFIVNPAVTVAGESDFLLRQIDYHIDSSGNRDTLTGVNESFFSNQKYLLIPPNTEVLFVRTVSGKSGNAAEVSIYYDFIEGEINV